MGPGGNVMAAALACLLASCICFSVAGCCRVGHLPGVGRSASNCCCVEKNADMQPEGKARIATPNNNSGQREGYQTRATTTTGYGNNQRGNRHNPMHMGHMARV